MSLLAISIITKNRPKFLQENLKNIVELIKENDFILNIYDNSDIYKEEVFEIYKKYKSENLKINYYGVEKILTYSENCSRAFLNYKEAKYLLVIGDSNYISKEKINLVVTELKKKYDFLILNEGRVRDIEDRTIYENKNKFFEELTWHCTLIGSTIYNANFLEYIVKNKIFDKYMKSDFLQLGILLDGIAEKDKFKGIFLKDNVLQSIKLKKVSYWRKESLKVFGIQWIEFIEGLSNKFQNKELVIKSHGIKSGLFTRRGYLNLKKEKNLNKEMLDEYRNILLKVGEIGYYEALVILFIPKKILKIYYKILRKLKIIEF